MNKQKRVEPIPEEFASYEEAAEFWDAHDTTDYPDAFRWLKCSRRMPGRKASQSAIWQAIFSANSLRLRNHDARSSA